jgi:outer membrane protein OmpA-like peptidoglycan-associated protein
MSISTAKILIPGLALALALALAGCTRPAGGGATVRLPASRPAGLSVIVASPGAVPAEVGTLVTGTALPGEHLQVVAGSGRVLASSIAPGPSVMAGPARPPSLPANPTQYLLDAHRRQQAAFQATLTEDRGTLAHALAVRLRSWAEGTVDALPRSAGPAGGRFDPQAGLSAAMTFFASLQQAGVGLGTRRVVVVLGAAGFPGGVLSTQSGLLSGVSVLLANFRGSVRAQQEWQAALLEAGAARAVVLAPAATDELAQVVRQGLDGATGPAPVPVQFGLNQATLRPPARALLRKVAIELTTVYPQAAVSVLGFSDPLGSQARNAVLATERSMATKAFLVSHGVAAARISAAGYGTDLPAAPSQPDGAQSLDRRAVVLVDPAM